ncbi:MAG: hypothetical protein P8X74_21610 [Reinekea sp.]
MDRYNYNSHNRYYSYSQTFQEDGQHTSQPEIGQTSAGLAASGPLWSHLAPGHQPYQGFNFPAQISPSLGSDWEYLLPPPQPTPLEEIFQPQPIAVDEIGQNDERPEPSNPQPAAKKRHRRSSAEIKKHFLAGFDKYAQGCELKDCSEDIKFATYITSNGRLRGMGQIQYNALEQRDKDRVDKALESRQEILAGRSVANIRVMEGFLGGLEAYASGASLKNCSATINFSTYVTTTGSLREQGRTLRESLPQRDKDRVDRALAARKRIKVELVAYNDTAMDGFLGGLDAYASGAQLKDCSATIKFSQYVTTDGRLLTEGERMYKKLKGGPGEAQVNEALAARRRFAAQRISGDLPSFLAVLAPYSIGLDLQACREALDVEAKGEMYLTPKGGLTSKGELLIENLQPDQRYDVWYAIGKRRQRLDPSAQAPESPWQLPEISSSMPEMGGMSQAAVTGPMQTEAMCGPMQTVMYDSIQTAMYGPMQAAMYDPIQTAMYDPIQTEALMAAAWQYTDQAMPGTWEIPSEPAESSIPYYDSDAVGTDFQHRYGSHGLMPQRAPDRLIGRGIVHDTLINIQNEVYRVHDTGRRSVNPTNENPQGNIIMLVPRMRGG